MSDAGFGLDATAGEQSAQVIQIDNGKHVNAVAICAALCGIASVFAMWAALTAWNAITEYRVMLNHTMELEAQQKVQSRELEELKHERR